MASNDNVMFGKHGFLDSGVKEILFKETHEQVGIGRGHMGAHGISLNLNLQPLTAFYR
jgi:hypothetical protein